MANPSMQVLAVVMALPLLGAVPLPPAPSIARPTRTSAAVVATAGKSFTLDVRKRMAWKPSPQARLQILSDSNGLHVRGMRLVGTPLRPAVMRVVVRDVQRDTAVVDTLRIVVFTANLPKPRLPRTAYGYLGGSIPVPRLLASAPQMDGGEVAAARANPVTDAGATLGRVLFYEKRLSSNDAVSCASCHHQQFGFGDSARFSKGVAGRPGQRHAMALTNARFTTIGFAWDNHTRTVEQQIAVAMQDSLELGLSADDLVAKLTATPYYPPLFKAAFVSAEITSERVTKALAQFVRALCL